MEICVMGLLLAAPCQCLTSGGNQTTSPGRTSCTGPFHSCTNPLPEVTISVCPSGWLCHAVLAPGLNSTEEPDARAGTWVENRCSIRTGSGKTFSRAGSGRLFPPLDKNVRAHTFSFISSGWRELWSILYWRPALHLYPRTRPARR